MDSSALRKFEVTGPDTYKLMQWVLTRDVKKLGVGRVVYSAMCYPHGGMIDDGTLFRMGPDSAPAGLRHRLRRRMDAQQAQALGLNVMIRSTDQPGHPAVQGPKSRDVMNAAIWTAPHQTAIPELGWFRWTAAGWAAPRARLSSSRARYTGELGYEIFCHPRTGPRSLPPWPRPASPSASSPWAWPRWTCSASRPG